jgi:monovalent cation:H+ antiporter-2, CPA2 family
MHVHFLQDLAIVMTAAGLVTVLFHRMGQPVVLGYLLAGLIIGPHTPPAVWIRDEETIKTLAELGVVFLMFSLGLHFSLRRLVSVGGTAVVAAVLEIVLMLWIGYEVGRFFGWATMDSLFLGATLSISSTTIIVKALTDMRRQNEPFASLIFGILIVEDLLAIGMIVMLSGVATTGTLKVDEVLATAGKLSVFLTVTLVAGLIAVPRMLDYVARFNSRETLLISTLGLCFGLSLVAVKLGYSVALGAFLIGAIIAESKQRGEIEKLIEPVRDLFSAVFFVAVGMMIEPAVVWEYALPIVVISGAVVVGKVVSCWLGTFVTGNGTRTSLQVGMGLAQIGEFSFIIAALGHSLNVTSDFLYPIVVTVSAITTMLTPMLIRRSDPTMDWIERVAPRSMMTYLEIYSRWVGAHRSRPTVSSPIRDAVRRAAIQIGINVAIVTGMLIAAPYVVAEVEHLLPQVPEWLGGTRGLAWLGAMVLALPVLVASVRKVRAMSMLLADVTVPSSQKRSHTVTVRSVVSSVVLAFALLAMGLWLAVLSAILLPPWPVLVMFVLLLITIATLAYRRLVRVYANAQAALHETLSHPPE